MFNPLSQPNKNSGKSFAKKHSASDKTIGTLFCNEEIPSRSSIIVIGGGAAGLFAALHAKTADPSASVMVLEKTAVFLAKVRISGGGRCNVTHACFDPKQLIQYYPRGGQELLGPFYRFQPKDTMAWFEDRGVVLKAEEDGRVFPATNQSQTIIDALLNEARRLNVELRTQQHIASISFEKGLFYIHDREGKVLQCQSLILATGSSREGYRLAQSLGHTIEPLAPSLFTFNVPNFRLQGLSGVSVRDVTISLPEISMSHSGPLLITHFGLSGPAVLKLSAWAARELQAKNYQTLIQINWVGGQNFESLKNGFKQLKMKEPSKTVAQLSSPLLPKNLWRALMEPWLNRVVAHLSHADLDQMCQILSSDSYQMDGKTTHKEEFVTCGGVDLKEIDFRTMESKRMPHLFFAGEILNIDGLTGGFNFQNAWTTGYLAGQAAAARASDSG